MFQDFDILYTVNTLIQDTAMKIKSYDTTLIITQPTIDISSGIYANLGDRIFRFTITVVTTSLNDQSIEILDGTANSYQNIDSEISNSEIITVINNVTTNTNGNTNLDTSYATTYFINDKQSQITLKVTDLYLNDDTATFSFTPEISFELACKDKFGYQTDNTNISIDSNIIPVNFANIQVNTIYTYTARTFGLNSTLIENNTFTGYQWQFYSYSSSSFTDIYPNASNITRTDGANLFGDYRCKITQKNHEGFQKKIYSSVFNNPEPTILSGKSFEITSPTSYTFEYIGDDNVALNSSWNKNFTNIVKYENGNDQLIRISRDDNDQFIYKISGTYKLEVFVRNQYYFGKYFTIGTYDVTSPAAPSITEGPKTYKSITINYTLNANGTPNQDPQNIILNMNAVEIKKDLPPTSTSYTKDELVHNTPYTFKIIKKYSDYDDVYVERTIQTYNKPTPPSITGYTLNLTSITVYFSLGSNSDDPTNNHNQGPSSFNIIITSGDGFNSGPTAGPLTSTNRTFTNLLPGRTFNFTLSKTYSNLDFGTYTGTGSSSTTPVAQATAPSISFNSNTITSITVNLSTNINGSATSDVTYTLTNAFSNTSSPPSSYTFTGLLPSTYYNFTFTKIIGSPWKDYPYNMTNQSHTLDNIPTANLTAPTPPTISSSSVNGSTITINYNLNGNEQYIGTTTASLYYSTSSFGHGGGTLLSSLSTSETSYTTSGLVQGTTYYFRIKKVVGSGYTSVGASTTYSDPVHSKRTGYDISGPTNVVVTASTTAPTINVSWDLGIGSADSYSIQIDYRDIMTGISSRNISNLDYSSHGLWSGTDYSVRVVKIKGVLPYYSAIKWFTTYTPPDPVNPQDYTPKITKIEGLGPDGAYAYLHRWQISYKLTGSFSDSRQLDRIEIWGRTHSATAINSTHPRIISIDDSGNINYPGDSGYESGITSSYTLETFPFVNFGGYEGHNRVDTHQALIHTDTNTTDTTLQTITYNATWHQWFAPVFAIRLYVSSSSTSVNSSTFISPPVIYYRKVAFTQSTRLVSFIDMVKEQYNSTSNEFVYEGSRALTLSAEEKNEYTNGKGWCVRYDHNGYTGTGGDVRLKYRHKGVDIVTLHSYMYRRTPDNFDAGEEDINIYLNNNNLTPI